MNARILTVGLTFVALALPVLASAQDRLYRYVDENGKVYYSDRVPPEHSDRDRDLLNDHGVRVGMEQGEITPEERAEMERVAKEKADLEAARAAQAAQDAALMNTYGTVGDIESLRDQRLEELGGRAKVTDVYLTNMRERLVDLQEEAGKYKPYTTNPDAPQIPDYVQADLTRTLDSINVYEKTLAQLRAEQEAMRDKFERDIARFKILKGIVSVSP